MSDAAYLPAAFSITSVEEAQQIILTPEAGLSSQERWEQETAWLLEKLKLPPGLVVDYGCGIGRIAKHLPNPVLGVDISESMRRLAVSYVNRNDFGVVSPPEFEASVANGVRANSAIAIWVLQHVQQPREAVHHLAAVLHEDAPLYVVATGHRCVPGCINGEERWINDSIDVDDMLLEFFDTVSVEKMPTELCEGDAKLYRYKRNAVPYSIETLEVTQAKKLNDLAMSLAQQGKRDAACVMLRRALALTPNLGHPIGNLGLISFWEGKHDEAMPLLRRAVEMEPTNHKYLGNLAVAASAVQDFDTAISMLDRAINILPNNYGAEWDKALCYLKRGDWEEGLKRYDVRFKHKGPALYPELPFPMWNGEDLSGKTIYVQNEQGIGDRILMYRYIAWLRETWPTARIVTCATELMINLFWSMTAHGVEVFPHGVPWPKGIDYGVWLMSLPRHHGTRLAHIPPDPGWIIERAEAEGKRCRLPEPNLRSLKVGICWTGSASNQRNADRSIPLNLLLQLAEDPRIQLYSFQVGPGHQGFIDSGAETFVVDLAPGLEKEGLVGTALALREMDLVISVCTSVAHLAGALKVPCWTLLCADPYWIWGNDPRTTPWYPDMKLFRQSKLGDWKPVIQEVQRALSAFLTEKGL